MSVMMTRNMHRVKKPQILSPVGQSGQKWSIRNKNGACSSGYDLELWTFKSQLTTDFRFISSLMWPHGKGKGKEFQVFSTRKFTTGCFLGSCKTKNFLFIICFLVLTVKFVKSHFHHTGWQVRIKKVLVLTQEQLFKSAFLMTREFIKDQSTSFQNYKIQYILHSIYNIFNIFYKYHKE